MVTMRILLVVLGDAGAVRDEEIDSNAPFEDAAVGTDRQRQWRGEQLPEVGDLAEQEA